MTVRKSRTKRKAIKEEVFEATEKNKLFEHEDKTNKK